MNPSTARTAFFVVIGLLGAFGLAQLVPPPPPDTAAIYAPPTRTARPSAEYAEYVKLRERACINTLLGLLKQAGWHQQLTEAEFTSIELGCRAR
jgi:hypothetical protein